MENDNFPINKRPKIITVMCWLTIISTIWNIVGSIIFLADYDNNIKDIPEFGYLFSPGLIFGSIIINIPIIIGAVGLYKMKKWGAWIFIGANVISALTSLSFAEQTKLITDLPPYIALIIPGLCIGIVLYYYKYFTDNSLPVLNLNTSSRDIIPDNSNLLKRLEQIHKMKEEGKLSEDEYLMMKNKIMSELTGKEIQSEINKEVRKDEAKNNKSNEETVNTPEDAGLAGKLEQLHKMKTDGKLSEEEYLMMKSKIISALTGNEIKSESEKPAGELQNKSQKEKAVTPDSKAQIKPSESTGAAGKLEQLYQMKEKDIISEEEFNSMKSKILLSMIEENEIPKDETKQIVKDESSKLKTNRKEEKGTTYSSASNQFEDKFQISKKVIYGGVVLILLALGFVFVYPKFSQEDDSEINKLIGYFSNEVKKEESKTNLQNTNSKKKVIQKVVIDKLTAKDESVNNCGFSGGEYPKISGLNDEKFQEKLNGILRNNVDEFKKIIKGEVSENWGDVNGFLDFEVLTNNDTLITIIQRTNWVVCGANGYGFDAYVLNADINSNRILTNDDMNIKSIELNKYNTIVYDFFKRQDLIYGNAKNPHSIMDYYPGNPDNFDYIPVVKSFEELNKYKFGYKNGKLVLIETAMPSSRASLSVYIIPMNFPSNTTSDETVASLSTEQVHGSDNASGLKENKTYGNASDIVKSWIESLGKRDFETAYNLMSPSLSKSYAVFTSLNRYGGITKTKVLSVETVSSSGCNYVVVATYDSYDPSNRDGKFTERFNVNNCYNYWQITNIKNISTEYFR